MGDDERREEIVGAVDGAVSTLVDLFEREPTRFFTENDLVCCFHRMLHEALAGLGLATAPDKDGKPHNLIHCEYPTPFRCDMGGKRFEIKPDDARTPGGKKYRRGRFGHWFVAYLPGKRAVTGNPFYAIGKVRLPRRAKTPHDPSDTIPNYLKRRRSNDHDSGYVYYTPVFYEDFTDQWVNPNDKISRYAQRVDVDQWQHFVANGVSLLGLNLIPRHKTVNAVFEIDKDFFGRIKGALEGENVQPVIPEEIDSPEQYFEGAVKTITVNAYERSREARTKCIEHHGWKCGVCGVTMADLYGTLGEGVIHVHHLRELASLGEEYEVDPITDLRPVCPNCHAILHTSSPAMTITHLRRVLSGRKPIRWPRKPTGR